MGTYDRATRQVVNRQPGLPDPRIKPHGHTAPWDGGALSGGVGGGGGGGSGGSGGGGGGLDSVTDGTHTVAPATSLDFTSGATVTDLGGGVAGVAVAAGAPVGSATPLVESGAGSAGASSSSSRQDHVHPAYGAAPYVVDANASPYSCVPDDVTDATGALQSAVNAAVSAAQSAGVGVAVVELEAGTYKLSSALSTTAPYYAQVTIPQVAATDSKVLLIIRAKHAIRGATFPNGAQTSAQQGVVVLHSTQTGTYSGTYGTPSVIGGPDPKQTSTWSNVALHLQSVEIRQPANPSLCGVNASLLYQCVLEDVRWDTEDASEASYAQPTNPTGIACLMPANNNNAMADYRGMCRAAGYFAGPGISEHTQAEKVLSYQCWVALNVQGDYYHGAQLDHASAEGCKYVLASVDPASGIVNPSGASGYSTFNVDLLDIEDWTSGWAATPTHVNDPGNDYYGRVRYIRVVAITGTVHGALTVSGAANLSLDDLTGLPAVSPSFATPAIAYGTPAAGAATTAFRSDATVAKPTAADVDFSADVTTSNATSGHHGLLPKLDANAAHYLDGSGAWSTPPGGGSTHYEVLMASGSADPMLTSDGLDYLYVEVPN